MKAPKNMRVYHKEVLRGEEIKLKKEPWVLAKYRKDYLDYLNEILTPSLEVVEFGSGGSSLYTAKRVKSLTVYEDDKFWHKMLLEEIAEEGLTNITHYLDPNYSKDFSNVEPYFDIAIVDVWNQPGFGKCLKNAIGCLRSSGILILKHSRGSSDKLTEEGWIILKKWRRWKTVLRKP